VLYLLTNLVQHQCTKHIEIDLHFTFDKITIGDVCILHVSTNSQHMDLFTKELPMAFFTVFQYNLNADPDPFQLPVVVWTSSLFLVSHILPDAFLVHSPYIEPNKD